jgi:type VII secretion-associated serine protease mycosin
MRVGALSLTGLIAMLIGAPPAAASVPLAPPVADKVRDEQWQLAALHAEAAWRISTGAGVTVAVIDSGVDATHSDLTGQVLSGLDLVDGRGVGFDDEVGHGTTVAALIAGRGDDARGVVGLAPGATILPVRVLDARNLYEDDRVVADAVRWSVDHGADVINLSLGSAVDSAALADAIDYAFERDVVVVACTGNKDPDKQNEVWYPAREPGVLAVTGLAHRGDSPLWIGSITGSTTVLSAPSNDLLGASPEGYWRVEGTSFAAPLVAATAALVRARWPEMSAANVVNRLIKTARDLGPAGRDSAYGFGEVDPVAALTDTVAEVRANPLDNVPPPGKATFSRATGVPVAPLLKSTEKAPFDRNHPDVEVSLPAGLAIVMLLMGTSSAARRRRHNWSVL